MSKRLNQEVKQTIDELWERGMDASLLSREIENIIDDRWPHYEAERDWRNVAERLGLM
ncbi:hypothetical protein [Paenibacillus sp. IHB B 3415]|uniref:hypothetical protein n=1 Tax=Paenibacillus sp. IHB B 3415 TaxID=867080 RepID=UPI000A74D258|nr:hypothetical protein [Paenibacillus sp. IHB B 3415]